MLSSKYGAIPDFFGTRPSQMKDMKNKEALAGKENGAGNGVSGLQQPRESAVRSKLEQRIRKSQSAKKVDGGQPDVVSPEERKAAATKIEKDLGVVLHSKWAVRQVESAKESLQYTVRKRKIMNRPWECDLKHKKKAAPTLNQQVLESKDMLTTPFMMKPSKAQASTTDDDKSSSGGTVPVTLPQATTEIVLLKSIFADRPPTAFFPYPSSVYFKQRTSDRLCKQSGGDVENLYMSFASDRATSPNFQESVQNAGFAITRFKKKIEENPYFNVRVSSYSNVQDLQSLNKYQKMNNFPGAEQLTQKDLLLPNLTRLRTRFPTEYDFVPKAYVLSDVKQYAEFLQERMRSKTCLWMCRPKHASRGRGVCMVRNQTHVPKRELIPNFLMTTKYISNPHLLNGFKYDLRVFALVTSYSPLKIYLYNDCLVRFCTEKYSVEQVTANNRFAHLTSYSVNKKNKSPQINPLQDLNKLKEAYEMEGIDFEPIHAQIKDLVVKTLISAEAHIAGNSDEYPTARNACYEEFSFDIMLDDKLRAWLTKTSKTESVGYTANLLQQRLSAKRLCDALTLVGIQSYDKVKGEEDKCPAPFARSMSTEELEQLEKGQLRGNEELTEDEVGVLMDLEDEQSRRGNFERIFPVASNQAYYAQFFESKRYENMLVAAFLQTPEARQQLLLCEYKRISSSEV